MFHRQLGQKSDKSNKALQKQHKTTQTTAPQVNGTHPTTLIQRAKLNPNSLSTDDVLRLQQTIGNRAATQLIAGRSGQQVQAKLTIGEPDNEFERQADRVAAQVVKQIHAPVSQQAGQSQAVQREEMSSEEKELQMKPMIQLQPGGGMAAAPDLEASIQQARGGGQPLANNIRKPMERAFCTDFSGVKVHTDRQSDQLNQLIQAKAFTTGQDVFFRQGEYNPGSRGGQELIAHELTHVMQQNGGVVERSQSQDGGKVPSISPTIAQRISRHKTSSTVQRVGKRKLNRLRNDRQLKEMFFDAIRKSITKLEPNEFANKEAGPLNKIVEAIERSYPGYVYVGIGASPEVLIELLHLRKHQTISIPVSGVSDKKISNKEEQDNAIGYILDHLKDFGVQPVNLVLLDATDTKATLTTISKLIRMADARNSIKREVKTASITQTKTLGPKSDEKVEDSDIDVLNVEEKDARELMRYRFFAQQYKQIVGRSVPKIPFKDIIAGKNPDIQVNEKNLEGIMKFVKIVKAELDFSNSNKQMTEEMIDII